MLNFDPALLGPYFTFRDYSISVAMTTGKQLLAANSSRILIAITSNQSGPLVRPGSAPLASFGFPVTANVAPLVFDFGQWGGLVGGYWCVWNPTAAATLYVLEIIYRPPGE